MWAVALSNSVLVTAGGRNVALWSLDTLSLIQTFAISPRHTASTVSISDDSNFAAIVAHKVEQPFYSVDRTVYLVDVTNRTTTATFAVSFDIRKLSFLPDKSQLVAQSRTGDFLSLDLINTRITNGPTLEHLIQLPDTPLWHGVPVWYCSANGQQYVAALFPQHQTPVPVLWIPSDIRVRTWTQGSSMIALGRRNGQIILLRLPTSHIS
jgi:WD40 repeat protein